MSRKRTTLLIVVFFALWPRALAAGLPPPSPSPRFQHLSIEDGLSQSSVRCVVQDHRGFIWLGTEDGLNRFDGRQFRVYRQALEGSGELRSNIIWTLFEDSRGTLWVGTDGGGLERYDRAADRFINLAHDPENPASLSSDDVRAIAEDLRGRLWIGTAGGGLNRYEPSSGEFTRFRHRPEDPRSLSCDLIRGLHFDDAGNLWIATWGGGLDCLDPDSGRFTHWRHDPLDTGSLGSNYLRTVFVDDQGLVWTSTERNGLDCLDPLNRRFDHFRHAPDVPGTISDDAVWCITDDHLGTLWVGTNNGLCELPPGNRRGDRAADRFIRHLPLPSDPHSLSQGRIRCIAEDRGDILWVGTYNGGVNLTERRRDTFHHLRCIPGRDDTLSDNEVRAFCQADEGRIWVGTYGGGLHLFHRDTLKFTRPGDRPRLDLLSDISVMSLAREPDGALWIGTHSRGLIRWIPGSVRLERFPLFRDGGEGPAPDPVRTLLVDGQGTVWAGTYGSGLFRRQGAGGRFTSFRHDPDEQDSLADDEVWALLEDASGTLWVGTNNGVACFRPETGTFTTFAHVPGDLTSLGSDRVRAIHEDASGTLWIGTYGGGLNRFDPRTRTFERFDSRQGLPGHVVYGITEDRLGRLWLSTNQGLTRFDPATATSRTFHSFDGLQSNEFNAGASLRAACGEMYFGGIAGFNLFRPEKIEDNPHPPQVVLTDLRIFNRSVKPGAATLGFPRLERQVSEADRITLTRHDYVVTFEFAALHFAAPEQNEYAYRLEGFEKEWNRVGSRRYATYTNLPPGDYTFHVIAANKDGVWNVEGASLGVTVRPPFWATLWFRMLALVFLAVTGFSVHTMRTRGIRRRNRTLEEVNTRLNQQIAERERAEQALHESEERYRLLFEDSPLGIFHFDEQGALIDCNKKFVEIIGRSRERMIGVKLPRVVRDPKLVTALSQALKSDHIGFYEGELREAGGGRSTQVRVMLKKITLASGDFLGAMGVVEDITEGKRLETQLRQSQKMEAVGRLAGGIAHDFNNLLTVILGYTELLLSRLDSSDPAHRQVAQIDTAGRRAASVTSQLLAFSRRQILKPEVLRLNSLIGDMEKMLRPLLGESIQLVTRLAPDLWSMEADPGQIGQVVMNLVINARDAMPDGGVLEISTANLSLEQADEHGHFSIEAGDHVLLRVADSGSGMDRATRRQIFEPFFTTKEKGKGTGLGLATVYGIIKQSGGYILVNSEPGEGTTFDIYFPRSASPSEEADTTAVGPAERQGSETILLVEDEEAVRDLLAETLEGHGYRIIRAEDAETALEEVRRLDGPLHLLLTDVVMPGLSGPELAEQLGPRFPDMRVLFMSGYTDEIIVHHGILDEGVNLLNKPLTVEQLLHGVRGALGDRAITR